MATTPIPILVPKKTNKKRVPHELAAIRHLLKQLRERVGRHPELEDAIVRLEILLSDLTVSSGGML